MPTINLLPWREELREVRKKEFLLVWVGCLILACFFMLLVHMVIQYQIKEQRIVNGMLNSEIQKIDAKITEVEQIKSERAAFISRIDVIQKLQSSRPKIVKNFDAMARLIPDGLYFTRIQRSKDKLTIEGKAESNTRVSELMRALDSASLFSEAVLTEIKSDKDEKIYKSNFEVYTVQQ